MWYGDSVGPILRVLAIAVSASSVALGCSSGSSDPARLQRDIAPFLDELAAYDRWARRISLADSAFHSDDAQREAAFAPLRSQPRVAAAWLDRVGPDPRALRYPDDAPALPEDGWVRVVTQELGELSAQRRHLTIGDRAREFRLLRRSRDAPGGAVLHVTLAFAPPEPE